MADGLPAHSIAIVGLAGRFPGARDLDEFWANIRDGVETLETFSDADLDAAGAHGRRGTTLEDAESFDATFFGLTPREAQILDPQHRLFLECALQALEHSGNTGAARDVSVGVYGGASMNTYLFARLTRDPRLIDAAGPFQLMLGNDKDFLCTRVSYKLDLRGPSMSIQTACSTSLVAVQVACRALQRHECDIALAGGVSVGFPQRAGHLFQEGMIYSPDGHCRPFDAEARGTRAGSGCGVVALKRLDDAVADGDTIHAVIRGAAVNNDGAGKAGFTAPGMDGQVEAIATALMLADVDPRTVGYIEAHGTGTPLGDPIEIAALTRVFRDSTSDVGFCRIGSLKANLGHLDAAAGVASLIKAVMVLKHGHIPPLVNFTLPNPQLELDKTPFVASAKGDAWKSGAVPRRAGVSSFGIGGTNAHIVLEEAPSPGVRAASRHPQLLLLSAKDTAALDRATAALAHHFAARPDADLGDVAWTLQTGRRTYMHRRAIAVSDVAHAVKTLGAAPAVPVFTDSSDGSARRVAFLFSGQGSQHSCMGAQLYESQPVFRGALDRCVARLTPILGIDLREVMFAAGADARINKTWLAQPALFVIEYALATLWASWGVTPSAMLGHSIGEYVAAHLAGVMSLDDALAVVAERGRLMQALQPGSMAAVHLASSSLRPQLIDGVEIAAINAPSLCTISGRSEAVAALLAKLQAGGVDARPLHTSHAFHSSMMEPALAAFTSFLATVELSEPKVPYVSNVTGTWITSAQARSAAYYAEHLRSAVKFEAGVTTLTSDPAAVLLEVGPGNVLGTLATLCVGKSGATRVVHSMPHPQSGREELQSLLESAGRLWIAGVPLEFAGLHVDRVPRRVPLPTYPFDRKRHAPDVGSGGLQRDLMNAIEQSRHGPDSNVQADNLAAPAPGADGSARQSRPALSAAFEAPQTPLETSLAAIWSELLGIEAIGVQDNFFELGGHSLLATRVLSRVQESLGAQLTLRDIFDSPTVRKMAVCVAARKAGAEDREEIEF